MKCQSCKKEINVGEHVYPGMPAIWHTKCGKGKWPAVMGSDGKLRWLDNQEIVSS